MTDNIFFTLGLDISRVFLRRSGFLWTYQRHGVPEPHHHLFGPLILLLHYSGHALDTLLAGHVGSMLMLMLSDRTDCSGTLKFCASVPARLLLLLLQLLLLLLLQVNSGTVVIRPRDFSSYNRFFGITGCGVMLPAKHRGQRYGTGHQVLGRSDRRIIVEPFQIHQVAKTAGRTLGHINNTRSGFRLTREFIYTHNYFENLNFLRF